MGVRTFGGNFLISLKVDICTGLLFGENVNTTGNCDVEWREFITALETSMQRKNICAQLITDDAPYFHSSAMDSFNRAKGIAHLRSPPYTQELDPAESAFSILFPMVRTAMIAACTPPAESDNLCCQ
jgi:hypothetical protein